MSETTSWPGLTDPQHSAWYIERFRSMAQQGRDLVGEARLVDALAERGSRILDAGCGPGRHGGYLAAAGHEVTGVDIDPRLVEEARREHPGCTWLVADLATLDLRQHGILAGFDVVFSGGNVLDFVRPGHRGAVVERLGAHLAPGGRLVIGTRTTGGVTPEAMDRWAADAGLATDAVYSTWSARPFVPGGDFAVWVLSAAAQEVPRA